MNAELATAGRHVDAIILPIYVLVWMLNTCAMYDGMFDVFFVQLMLEW